MRLWYVVTSIRAIVMCPKGVDELTVLILDEMQIVFWYEMPSLLVITDAGLHCLISVHWIEDKSSVLHKLLWAKSKCDLECFRVEVPT